jgi:hypothetical protein
VTGEDPALQRNRCWTGARSIPIDPDLTVAPRWRDPCEDERHVHDPDA